MDERVALHTAARRYCMERAPWLSPALCDHVYRRRAPVPYTDFEAMAALGGTSMQVDVLGAILRRIEAHMPDAFPSAEALRAFLLEIGKQTATQEDARPVAGAGGSLLYPSDLDEEQNRELAEEQARFCAYIDSLSSEALGGIAPLPRRRLLSERETERLWGRLERKWQVPLDDFWYPIGNAEVPPPHVLAFDDWDFAKQISLDLLRGWLRKQRARPVFELQASWDGSDYEMDLEFFIPEGKEAYWTSEKMDWVLYASHENSITIGGEWLLNLVKRSWPDWAQHLRTTHLPQILIDSIEQERAELRATGLDFRWPGSSDAGF